MNILPKTDKIKIPTDKFIKYALNYDRDYDKALAFELALGYNLTNYQMLMDNIKSDLDKYSAVPKGNRGHGERYEVILKITGANGKEANVLTGWIDDINAGEMRLTTVHVVKRKGGKTDD